MAETLAVEAPTPPPDKPLRRKHLFYIFTSGYLGLQ